MTDHLEPKERAGTSVAVHDRFEGGAAGVAAWLPALNAAERPMGVRDGVPANAFRRVHRSLPFQCERLGARSQSHRAHDSCQGGFRLQVADVVAMVIDPASRAGRARGSEDPVRSAIRIHPGTLTGRATDLTLDLQAGRDRELTLQKWPSYTD